MISDLRLPKFHTDDDRVRPALEYLEDYKYKLDLQFQRLFFSMVGFSIFDPKVDSDSQQLDFECYMTILNRIARILELLNKYVNTLSLDRSQKNEWMLEYKRVKSILADVRIMRDSLDHYEDSLDPDSPTFIHSSKSVFRGFRISEENTWIWNHGNAKMEVSLVRKKEISNFIDFVFEFFKKIKVVR